MLERNVSPCLSTTRQQMSKIVTIQSRFTDHLSLSQPRKDRILAKHEFAGNKPLAPPAASRENTAGKGRGQPGQTQREPHRGGRGGSSSRGGGSGRGRGGSSNDSNVARDRARKDKAGNQQRRRGHDKKMARGGAAPP